MVVLWILLPFWDGLVIEDYGEGIEGLLREKNGRELRKQIIIIYSMIYFLFGLAD